MMDPSGEDEVGHTKNGEEIFEDAEEGDCFNGNCESNGGCLDEGDALGRPGSRPGEIYARMPVPKYATHYKMDHKKRGVALIFNHEMFECFGLKSRAGTNEDCRNLSDSLRYLGFDVQIFKDLSYMELENRIRDVSAMDHTHHDCLFIAVLSHGESNIVYAKDNAYKPDILWTFFTPDRCPTLAGKPKMFFMQACQGDKLDGGVNLAMSRTETDGEIFTSYKIPSQADFLIVFSTVHGYYSWRNTTKGSWFVQALSDELQRRAHEQDLMTILTFVSQRVAVDFESNVPDSPTMHRQKQIPCVMSMLTRLIKFTIPGYGTSSGSK
ncbi:hypothetical protein D910_05588 [Dendroctonus ponderosae]